MSRLEELIQTLCSDGMEYLPLGKLCLSLSKGTLTQDKLSEIFQYPVINSGRDYYGRYSQYNNEGNALVIASRGEYAGFISYISEKFWAGGLCYPYRSIDENKAHTKYIFYVLKNSEQKIMDSLVARGSIPALNKTDIDKFLIPLPPLPVQEEIVRILDTFSGVVTELEQNLEAEQEARVKQYEHYRNELLAFESKSKIIEKLLADFCPDEVEYVKLKEVAKISAGGDLPENYVKGQKVPTKQHPFPIYSNGTNDNALYGFTDSYKIKKEAVTISARGTIGYHEVRAGKFTPIVRLITMVADESRITTRFLNYVLYVAGIEGVKTGIPSLTVPMLAKITVPLPPLSVQQEIVSILDRFDTLVNDLKDGLPAEIVLRRKQYEYYRDKLLSFEPSE